MRGVMSIIVKLVATVKFTGKRYFVLRADGKKVHTRGEVLGVGGFDATYGPDKTFLASAVNIHEVEYTEELLAQLYEQGTGKKLPPAPPPPKVRARRPRSSRRRWLKRDKYTGRLVLTSHARTRLWREGYGVAEDGLGNYLDEGLLSDAAMDLAAYHPELSYDGAREGFNNIREAAADYLHEGMQACLKEAKKTGRKITMERA
jgi:hypothetical protein